MTHEVDLMSLRAPRRFVAAAAVPALLAGVAVAAPANAAPAADEPKYKGAAFALQARVALGGETLLDLMLPDVVTFPTGGDKNLLGLPGELKDVATLKVLNASAGIKDQKFAANASTAGLNLLGNLVGAAVLNSDCTADRLKLAGDSQVVGLELLGTKIPVDPGPNFRIDIPKELEALLKGSIVIDEQNKLDGGGIQVRALHINLVIAPDALGAALKSALASVRQVAQQLTATVEAATGQTLDELLTKTTKTVAPQGGAQADRSVRSKTVATKTAKVAKADKAEVTASSRKAAAPKAATSTEEASVAGEHARTETAAENTGVSKADEAAVARQSAADQAAAERQLSDRAERGAKPAEAQSATSEQQAAEAAAAARAEGSTAQGRTDTVQAPATQADATQAERADHADQAIAAEQATRTEQKAVAAQTAENDRAQRTAANKGDGAVLRATERTEARVAAPAADDDDDIDGLVGVDVIVSETNCVGARFAKAQPPKRVLPKTGGGDMAQDMAVTGLGLLLAGSAAAFVTRRRRNHH